MPAAEHFSKESGAEGRAVKALLSFSHISYQTKQREFMLYPHKGDVQTTCHWRNPSHDTETFCLPLRADRRNAFRNYQRCRAPAVPPWFCCVLGSVRRIDIIQYLCMSYFHIYSWIFKHWPYAWCLVRHQLCLEEIICYIFLHSLLQKNHKDYFKTYIKRLIHSQNAKPISMPN